MQEWRVEERGVNRLKMTRKTVREVRQRHSTNEKSGFPLLSKLISGEVSCALCSLFSVALS